MDLTFRVNGKNYPLTLAPATRLSDVLRDHLGLIGTKVGCNAGDCGACTVLVEDRQICACMMSAQQAAEKDITTVEGLGGQELLNDLQAAFLRHGAVQCGICTPGMLMAASDLLRRNQTPNRVQVEDALGGVLCRCTGYQKIIEAVMDVTASFSDAATAPSKSVGVSIAKLDGPAKLTGTEIFGADAIPADCLWVKIIRSPFASADIELGDFADIISRTEGLEGILTHKDVPFNRFGIYATGKDQPVLAETCVRYRGDAIVAVVGTREGVVKITLADLLIRLTEKPPVAGIAAAKAPGAAQLHADKPGNLLIEGQVLKSTAREAPQATDITVEGRFETSFVEHAYIEPEAGWAQPVGPHGSRGLEMHVTTQTAAMDRAEIASILQIDAGRVRVLPTACGGGFGGKLDLSVQPVLAVAALRFNKPVACVYERPESMAASTKRHPTEIACKFTARRDGRLVSVDMTAEFNTGAYASWGPTVAERVPVHGSGPYYVPNVHVTGRAYFTNSPPSGAFRGFGVPQAAIAHEAMMDDLAEAIGVDRLDIRLLNAVRCGDETATGQVLQASAGLAECLQKLQPHWTKLTAATSSFNQQNQRGPIRKGVGIGAMWYGIGNTAISNPSTMDVGIGRDGSLVLFNGAVDIGQGSNTILPQICADALGLPVQKFSYIMGDTDLTRDAGKTSASRQTFVSGKAAEIAGTALRGQILRHANAGTGARLDLAGTTLRIVEDGTVREIELSGLASDKDGMVFRAEGRFDPPTMPLDGNGQGVPYATYGFAAQIAEVSVDLDLGTTRVTRILAAHDVGRAINPQQVEGQIHGGIAQGLGMALMEEYIPGKTENLHDYLIPTIGDMPEIDVFIIEDPEPLGPFGAKGVGEPGLVPTAPAIFSAIRNATGVRVTRAPMLPHRLRAAILRQARTSG
ncbi:molybdopterin-dependent oxidoreductase [Sneathiella sp.]|uniref:molybdopterin-dependent oxidoreductase n=1 Tax=Sneathiella sp. TaxID=1964365 RepID=UPI0035685012